MALQLILCMHISVCCIQPHAFKSFSCEFSFSFCSFNSNWMLLYIVQVQDKSEKSSYCCGFQCILIGALWLLFSCNMFSSFAFLSHWNSHSCCKSDFIVIKWTNRKIMESIVAKKPCDNRKLRFQHKIHSLPFIGALPAAHVHSCKCLVT